MFPSRRDGAVRYFCALAGRDSQAVVGMDFNFSFPSWWLDRCRVGHPAELWGDAARMESWLAGCPPPFWGRLGRGRPALELHQQFRATELAAPVRPKSVFQIGGAGAVGTASLRGMPALAQLQRAGFAIWPFDGLRDGVPAAVEVWPRLAALRVVRRHPHQRRAWLQGRAELLAPGVAGLAEASEDAFDAVAAVLALAGAGRDALPAVGSPLIRREGWISGVPLYADPHSCRAGGP